MTTAHLAVTTGLPPAPDTSNVPPPPTPAPKEHLVPKPLPNGSFDAQSTSTASATSGEAHPAYTVAGHGYARELFVSALVIGAASVILLIVALALALRKKRRGGSL